MPVRAIDLMLRLEDGGWSFARANERLILSPRNPDPVLELSEQDRTAVKELKAYLLQAVDYLENGPMGVTPVTEAITAA